MSAASSPPNLLASFADKLIDGIVSEAEIDAAVQSSQKRPTFREFVDAVAPGFKWYEHVVTLSEVVEGIVAGRLKRILVWMPPGTGKSEVLTRLLGAYYITCFPSREVGLVSYGADLAGDLAGDARDYYVDFGGELDPSTNAKDDWYTKAGGGMWGKGFGGPIRGRRFHLGIVDDPHKGPEDLESEAISTKFTRWWKRTWLNRQNLFFEEGAALLVVMQRLAVNDLCGWLLEQKDAAQWTVVALDAVRSEEPWDLPEGVTLWPDDRAPGELLCPDLLGEKQLAELGQDEATYDAQYLQRPVPVSGTILDPAWFKVVGPESVPPLMRKAIGVDLAVRTSKKNDETCAIPVGVSAAARYYFFAPLWGRFEAPVAEDKVAELTRRERVATLGVESNAYQLSFVQHLRLRQDMVGVAVIPVTTDKDKLAGVRGWSPIASDGLIVLVEDGSGWTTKFLRMCPKFPKVPHDDIFDAMTIALGVLRTVSGHSAPAVGGKRN